MIFSLPIQGRPTFRLNLNGWSKFFFFAIGLFMLKTWPSHLLRRLVVIALRTLIILASIFWS